MTDIKKIKMLADLAITKGEPENDGFYILYEETAGIPMAQMVFVHRCRGRYGYPGSDIKFRSGNIIGHLAIPAKRVTEIRSKK